MSGDKTIQPHNVVWDPGCPARVLILPHRATTREKTDGSAAQPAVNYLWSHTGSSSCNKHETSALIKIIQALEEYHERLDRTVDRAQPSRVFSRQCRAALRECLLDWSAEIQEQAATDDTVEKTEYEQKLEEQNMENLELLKVTYSAMHLSDVILPLLPVNSLTNDFSGDLFGVSGAASANFVRYLRSHHMESAELIHDDVAEMLQSTQPDQFGDGTVYWLYVETLVVRGLLEDAWNILERHSQYQTALAFTQTSSHNNNPGIVESMNEVLKDFAILREVLLRAPLPGGRNDLYDDALSTPRNDDDDDAMETDMYLEGLDVVPSDYAYWDLDTSDDTGDFPNVFTPEAAIRKHTNWQSYVKRKVRRRLATSRRLPQIEKILSILCGDFTEKFCDASWPEKLCAEIIYQRPDCRPRDLSKLTSRAMREYGVLDKEGNAVEDEPFAKTIVQITAGNAGTAISTFYMLGGASGAALSTTLLAVLYYMFLEASIVSPDAAVHKTEFLTEAAVSIVSSLASIESDIGINLAVRLLLPFAMQDDCSPEIIACFAEILEHYNPINDADAKNVVLRCEMLIREQKSRRVLESCSSVVLCRYRFYLSESKPRDAVAWLLRGIKVEAMMTVNAADGSCYRTLAALCFSTAEAILNAMSKSEQVGGDAVKTAREMAAEIEKEDTSKGVKIREFSPVVVFMQAHAMFEAALNDDRALLPKCIVTCLNKGTCDKCGSPSTFMPLPMQAALLEIACKLILDESEQVQKSGTISTVCVFDKRGISLLMESLLLLEAHGNPAVEYDKTKEVLLRGLSQAMIAENAMKPLMRKARGGMVFADEGPSASNRTCSLSEKAPHKQQEIIDRMLDF